MEPCQQESAIQSLGKSMDRMFDKLDYICKETTDVKLEVQRLSTQLEIIPKRIDVMEKRISEIEKYQRDLQKMQYAAKIVTAVLSAIVGALASLTAMWLRS